jgi:hypothetical protein
VILTKSRKKENIEKEREVEGNKKEKRKKKKKRVPRKTAGRSCG